MERHITREAGFLSYPDSAIVMVYSKQMRVNGQEEELWEAEVSMWEGRQGRTGQEEEAEEVLIANFFHQYLCHSDSGKERPDSSSGR